MEKEIIFLVEEAPEGGYQARALGHAIFTRAHNLLEGEEKGESDQTLLVILLHELHPQETLHEF